ncbi:MAG: glutamate mutase L, partial [Chloroflexota bacterium]
VLDTISLSDPRRSEAQIDSILRIRPDLIAIAGGTDRGASRSMLRILNTVGFAVEELPINFKPEILYAGNKQLSGNVINILGELAPTSVVDNIRPNLETENFGPAELRLIELFRKIYGKSLLGAKELELWAGGNLIPSSIGFGRVVQFLSQVYDQSKGVLGINVGASSTIAASSFGGDLNLRNFNQLGIGSGLTGLLATTKVEDIQRWIPYDVSDDEVISYLYNKSIYPASLPATGKDLAIEQALAREVIRSALNKIKAEFPQDLAGPARGGLPWFEPIMVGGSVITDAPGMNQALLMILDGVQPTGISRIILDKNSLAPALGAVAGMNAMLAVQVLESNAFFNLGSVISPIGRAKPGSPVVRVTIRYASGQESTMDVKFGTIKTIPLPIGQPAEIHLQPLNRFDVGMGGPGKSGRLRVVGGYFGVIIDARGRPLILPKGNDKRKESLIHWQKSLKG